ncbi:unnamed protein product [Urochloa decumbens]|uniref:Uncharacterized protein n=1 Tax=Urochloa decumbens TaxID=240449 RepID=A0ABC9DM19_9POAL
MKTSTMVIVGLAVLVLSSDMITRAAMEGGSFVSGSCGGVILTGPCTNITDCISFCNINNPGTKKPGIQCGSLGCKCTFC